MEDVLVRYGEIGTKSRTVRRKMVNVLRQRIEDRLEYEDTGYETVSGLGDRILLRGVSGDASFLSEIPGVKNFSPCRTVEKDFDSLEEAVLDLEYGESFGVRCRSSKGIDMSSREVEEELGGLIQKEKGLEVDLDSPDTWVYLEFRESGWFLFTDVVGGVDGYPVGCQETVACLLSGGIDSPVAAYRMMCRGCDILPVYFYNSPLVSEDHVMRLERIVSELERFNPSKDWRYVYVDMSEVNKELLKVGKGRMILHRVVMFRVAEEIAEREGLSGIVTGESLGQKSTQTAHNLGLTSSMIDLPVHRPLLTSDKDSIVKLSRELGFFDLSTIDSACRDLSPDNPSTSMKRKDLDVLGPDTGELVDKALEATEIRKV